MPKTMQRVSLPADTKSGLFTRRLDVSDVCRMKREELPEHVRDLVARSAPDLPEGTSFYRFSISSEKPVFRMGWREEDDFMEVLPARKDAIDPEYLEAGMAILLHHDTRDPMNHIGRVWDWGVRESKVELLASYSDFPGSRGPQIEYEAFGIGIRNQVSLGYRVANYREVKPGKKNPSGSWVEYPVREAMPYKPMEGSHVPVAADVDVGPNRSGLNERKTRDPDSPEMVVDVETEVEERQEAPEVPDAQDPNKPEKGRIEMPEPDIKELEARLSAAEKRNKDLPEMHRLSQQFHAVELFEKAREDSSVTLEVFRKQVMDSMEKKIQTVPHAESIVNGDRTVRRIFSARKAAMECLGGEIRLTGVEKTVHEEVSKRLPVGYEPRGGFYFPLDLRTEEEQWAALEQERARSKYGRRAVMTSNQPGTGSDFVPEAFGEMIELYRNESRLIEAGVRVITGLSSPVSFPKQTGPSTARWVGENSGKVAGSNPTTGFSQLAPKTLTALLEYTRAFMLQSAVGVEAWLRDDISQVMAIEMDRAAIHGVGANGEPLGLMNTPLVQIQDFGSAAATWKKILGMPVLAAQKNALRGTPRWLTTPGEVGSLMATPKNGSGYPVFLADGNIHDFVMAGYEGLSTNQISATLGSGADQGLLFGDFRQGVFGYFGALEVVSDIYTRADEAIVRIIPWQMCDFMARHPEAFAKATTLLAA